MPIRTLRHVLRFRLLATCFITYSLFFLNITPCLANRPIATNRDNYIDFLRSLGLLLLVVAHTAAPKAIEALRTFDVPLMVFVSALCYRPLVGGYFIYARKRFIRIYKPVFIFLTIIFLAIIICNSLYGKPEIKWPQIIGSYLLLNQPSIGYIWIMRVFIIIALAIPFLYKYSQRQSWLAICLSTAIIIVIQHYVILLINLIYLETVRFVLSEIIPYLLGYSAIALPALKIKRINTRQMSITLFALILSLLIFFFLYGIESPQLYKYPPQSLYILYGLFCSIGLWKIKPAVIRLIPISNRAIRYLSQNSMWIYLWHIIPVYVVDYFSNIFASWPLRYIFVLTTALICTELYNKISSQFSIAFLRFWN